LPGHDRLKGNGAPETTTTMTNLVHTPSLFLQRCSIEKVQSVNITYPHKSQLINMTVHCAENKI